MCEIFLIQNTSTCCPSVCVVTNTSEQKFTPWVELPISCSQSHTRTRTRLRHNVVELNTTKTDFFSRVRAPDNGSRLYRKFGKSCDREKRQRNFWWQSRFTKFVEKRVVLSAELWLFWNGSKWHSTVHEKSGHYLDVGG